MSDSAASARELPNETDPFGGSLPGGYVRVPPGHWEHFSWTDPGNLFAEILRLRKELRMALGEPSVESERNTFYIGSDSGFARHLVSQIGNFLRGAKIRG